MQLLKSAESSSGPDYYVNLRHFALSIIDRFEGFINLNVPSSPCKKYQHAVNCSPRRGLHRLPLVTGVYCSLFWGRQKSQRHSRWRSHSLQSAISDSHPKLDCVLVLFCSETMWPVGEVKLRATCSARSDRASGFGSAPAAPSLRP